jgi:hypothetical protein
MVAETGLWRKAGLGRLADPAEACRGYQRSLGMPGWILADVLMNAGADAESRDVSGKDLRCDRAVALRLTARVAIAGSSGKSKAPSALPLEASQNEGP